MTTQPDPELMAWRDPKASDQRSALTPQEAATSWAWDCEEILNDAIQGGAWEGEVSLYVVEHDGEKLLGEVIEYKVPYETHRMFGVPKPPQQA